MRYISGPSLLSAILPGRPVVNGQPPRSHRWKMPLHRVVWMTACGLTCAPAGCQQLVLNTAPLVTVSQPAQPPQQIAIVADSSLRKRLFHDHWRAGEIWPEPIEGPQALARLKQAPLVRWELQTEQPDGASDAVDAEAENSEQTSKTASGNRSRRDQSLQDLIDLQTLSVEDSLPGWNACIQLAWKQPRVDARVLATLQKLALDPPRYSAQDGLQNRNRYEPLSRFRHRSRHGGCVPGQRLPNRCRSPA